MGALGTKKKAQKINRNERICTCIHRTKIQLVFQLKKEGRKRFIKWRLNIRKFDLRY